MFFLWIFGITLTGCAKPYVKFGPTQGFIGPDDVEGAGQFEIGTFNPLFKVTENSEIMWGTGLEIMGSNLNSEEDDYVLGFGWNLTSKYSYYIGKDWELYLGGGGVLDLKNNYRDHEALGPSRVFGIIFGGIRYDIFSLEIKHQSSPFHGGDEGDVGLNYLMLGINFLP